MIIATILFCGCNSKVDSDNDTTSASPPSTSDQTLFWQEIQGHFSTRDIARAQKEIPFIIILPSYLPEDSQNRIPGIQGTLKSFQEGERIGVEIMYALYPETILSGVIVIRENNYGISIGDPESDHDLELVEIKGISVVKTKDDWSPPIENWYCFNSKDIYYLVELHGLPNEESYKIVESMIIQITSQ